MPLFKRPIIVLLDWASDFSHVVISLALAAATITIFFFHEVYLAIKLHSLIKDFLHALGILLLLWTMVELINIEISYLNGKAIDAISNFIKLKEIQSCLKLPAHSN